MLVRYLTRRDIELKRLQTYSGVPTIPDLYQDPGVLAATPYLPALQKEYKKGFALRPSTDTGKKYSEVSKAYFESVHAVLTGESTAAKATADLEAELIRITGLKAGTPSEEAHEAGYLRASDSIADRDSRAKTTSVDRNLIEKTSSAQR
jgi:trehalose/maltose transport system substrate-binding protein